MFRYIGRFRLSLTLLLLAAHLTSCAYNKVLPGPPAEVLAHQEIKLVRVTLVNKHKLWVQLPRIVNDSMLGTEYGDRHHKLVAIPVDSIKQLAVQRTDAVATVALVGISALALAVVIAAASIDPMGGAFAGGSSCPQVYSWDGSAWRLDSGTFGGAIAEAFTRSDVDNLRFATPEGDQLRLRVANELDETDYVDALTVLAIDHDPAVTVAPAANGTVHTLGTLQAPAAAVDDRGRDVLAQVRATDGWNWESALYRRDTSRIDHIRDGIDLTFTRSAQSPFAKLVIEGHNTQWAAAMMQTFVAAHGSAIQPWYDSLKTYPGFALNTGLMLAREGFLDVQVWQEERWVHQAFAWEAGPEISKQQVVPIDLSGVTGDTVRIRLESAPMFWLLDQVAIDYSPDQPVQVHEITPNRAVSNRGEDVARLLSASDHADYVVETGESAELSFTVPSVPAGLARSYLLRSTGWYRLHVPDTDPPDRDLLARAGSPDHGASRLEVDRFNRALDALSQEKP